jgi:hypothetical protein
MVNELNYVPIACVICGVNIEHAKLKGIKPMKNLSRHTELFELVTSSLKKGMQMGKMSKLSWLIGFVKHAIWAYSLYFLYLLLLSSSEILSSSQMTLRPSP